MKSSIVRGLAATALLAMASACGGNSGVGPAGMNPAMNSAGTMREARVRQSSILSNIVGVGDSLTAGYQSNGFLGATNAHNPYKGGTVPPGQENGWWADLYEQASGKSIDTAIADMYDPSVSPLPLIAAPGLNNQIVASGSPFFPITELKLGNICTDNHGFNLAGYHLNGLSRVRMDATSSNIRNLGIPGLTLHEANVLHQPQSTTCNPIAGIPGLLNLVVADESATFWPVLGNYAKMRDLTDVNAAASTHPTLATVWLGANDVLKYMGSGGRFVGGDRTPGQAESDVRASISTLQHAGAKVVVANLPNILEVGYFQRVTIPTRKYECRLRTYAYCLLNLGAGVTPGQVKSIARTYHLDTPNGCTPASVTRPCGYLTLAGSIEIVQYLLNNSGSGSLPDLDCAVPKPKCKDVPGSGLGNWYITPEFAGKIQALNDAMNEGIDEAATASHVPLVDVQAIFHGIASGDATNPYFHLAASINPGLCCTLGYLWGLTSFDGLHPSNTGYALIAYVFIDTINKAYGTKIPEIDPALVYEGKRCSNSHYCFPDPYAPPNDAPYK